MFVTKVKLRKGLKTLKTYPLQRVHCVRTYHSWTRYRRVGRQLCTEPGLQRVTWCDSWSSSDSWTFCQRSHSYDQCPMSQEMPPLLIDPASGLRNPIIRRKISQQITRVKAYRRRVRSLLAIHVLDNELIMVYLTTDGFPGPDFVRKQEKTLISVRNFNSTWTVVCLKNLEMFITPPIYFRCIILISMYLRVR